MDTQFEWSEDFKIGVDIIDKEHRRLFKIINKLFALKEEENNGQWACQEGIKFFKGHAVKHFEDEEDYMASIGYKGLEQHRRIHKSFRENTLPTLEQELEQTGYSADAVDHFLGVCAGWLIGHTLTEDLSIIGKHAQKWENLLPEEEMAAMKKVVVQLVFDMFHLESQLISDAYGGEKFGTGVYYRLSYGNEADEKRQDILLVFEERLLVNTVGKVMGLSTNRLDARLVHASRYTAQQFARRVLECFSNMETYELREETLLNYEQFQKVFEKEKMQVSLLFDTGAGYFSFCVIAPHLLEEGVGTPIEAENALTEVEEYLMKREEQVKEEQAKPKILVVDDSSTILRGMRDLLDKDYEVALAESGIAAIRTMTLNRPDLILLDYEMPVCDGKQTLEMLRSAKEFRNIPVIFLTGRSDPATVKGVMSLKPAGYLLKYLKSEEIKQKIDVIFERQRA